MTIPTLITNNQEKGWQTAASTFEAKFGQALKVMNTQNTLAGLNTTENFVAELQRHMKINKVCDNSKLTECFTSEINGARSVIDVADATTYENDASKPTKTNTLITADKIGQKDWGTNTMGLQFANGVSAIVAYNPKCSANPFNNDSITVGGSKNNITFGTDCVAMVYDTQSFKNPNELHKDIRTSSMATVGDGNCVFKIDGKCVTKVIPSDTGVSKSECEAMIITHDIPSCSLENDTFAGAVKTCHGLSKLINAAQVAKLANYLYGVSNIVSYDYVLGLTINNDKALALGLNFSTRDSIWMSDTTGPFSTETTWTRRVFNSTSTFYNGRLRDDPYLVYTICIGE